MKVGHGADVKALLRRHKPDAQWSPDLASVRSTVQLERIAGYCAAVNEATRA